MKTRCILLAVILFAIHIEIAQAQNGVTTEPLPAITPSIKLRFKNCIATDAANNVYVGFNLLGLGKYVPSSSSWSLYDTTNSGIASNKVLSTTADNNGNIWAGTPRGLSKYDGINWTTYNKLTSGIISDTIQCLKMTPLGIWCGTMRGLSFFDGASWTNYTTANSGILSDTIYSIDTDSSNRVLIGNNKGLSVFDGSTWTNYSPANSDLPGGVSNVLYISSKATWLKTSDGLCKLSFGSIINKRCLYNTPTESYYFENPFSVYAKNNNILYAYIDEYTLAKIDEDDNIELLIDYTGPDFIYPSATTFLTFDNNGIMWAASGVNVSMGGFSSFNESLSAGFAPFSISQFSSQRYININQVAALICNNGSMFWNQNPVNASAQYEVPKCTGKSPIFANALWLGGYDATGNLHLAGQTYMQSNTGDYWTGPLDTINGTTDSITAASYNNIWKINKTTIDDFKTNFLNGNVSNGSYPVPLELITYPGNGTGNYAHIMSPYVDYNNDGNYDPYAGDYPLIKGDQQLYWIFNDMTPHNETFGIPLGVEIRGYAYAYNCDQYVLNDSDAAINYTTYYRYEITNRSINTYDSVYVGLFSDTDLGDAFDDYVGCDSVLNAGFSYNGDNDDASGAPYGYGLKPPMINCQVLQGPEPVLNDGIDNDHDGTIDEAGEMNMMTTFHTYTNSNNTPNGNPSTPDDYYQYMTSSFLNGTPVTYGGDGSGGTIPTNYQYSGTPYAGTGWDEMTAGNPPDDRRFVVSSGPFHLAPGETKSIDFAYVFTWDSTAANGLNTSIARNRADLQKVKYWFDNNNFPGCMTTSVETTEQQNADVTIYPNPTEDYLNVVCKGTTSKMQLKIYDIAGRETISRQIKSNDKIDVRSLTSGVYLVKIVADKNIVSKRFIRK